MRHSQVSDEILKQTQEILNLLLKKLGRRQGNGCDFCNQWTQSWTKSWIPWSGSSTDVISLEYKPEMEISFDEDLAEKIRVAEMMANSLPILVSSLFQLTRRASKLRRIWPTLSAKWDFSSAWFLHINGYLIYTPEEERNVWLTGRDLTAYGLWAIAKMEKSGLHFKPGVCTTGIFTAIKEERNMRKHALSAALAILAGLVFKFLRQEWLFCCSASPWWLLWELWIQPLKMWWI